MAGDKIRVLLLVAEAWREDSAGGNVIQNLFGGMDAEFAQVYINALMPANKTCTRYFQISLWGMVKNFVHHRPVGRVLDLQDITCPQIRARSEAENRRFDFFRVFRLNLFVLLKEVICSFSNWKTKELRQFIEAFGPDVVFAPCYASPFMLSLTRYVKDLTGKKIVTYSGDDNYSLRQFSLSPFFWLNRLAARRCLKKTYPYYDLFYSMSEDEIKELSPVVGQDIKLLRKGFVPATPQVKTLHSPIRLIYAGGLYIDRWKVLAQLGAAIKKINGQDGLKIQLHIYTGTPLSKRQRRKLHNGRDFILHEQVEPYDLDEIYRNSDLALHCESLSLRKRYITRLSFSTKITDCLKSGCAVMVIAWKEHTGLKYLEKHGAAICVESKSDIEPVLNKLISQPGTISAYAELAAALGQKNHDINTIQQSVYDDFVRLINN